jgi:hypothetical protein
MSKKFNVKEIVHERKNELDNSPLFQTKSPPAPVQASSSTTLSDSAQVLPDDARVPSPFTNGSPKQTEAQPLKRSFVRRTFDFYEEQIAYLKQESLQEQLEGKEGSMNAMVREAIDEWIKKRTATK